MSRWDADAPGAPYQGGYDPQPPPDAGDPTPYGAPVPSVITPVDGGPKPPTSTRLIVLLVALGVLVAAGVAGVVVWRLTSGPDYPASWDPRVQDLVNAVEKERHLIFEHPVYVDFMSEADFQAEVTSDDSELSDKDREEIDNFTGLFRSLGLVSGDFDLFESTNALNGAGIIGYYSFDDERIRVRGTEVTPAVSSTLVHELTHALQDQHFDLGGWIEELKDDPARATVFRAVVEGDARRVESDWRASLKPAERKALDKAEAAQTSDFEDDAADVPQVLKTMMGAPYAFGEAMVGVAAQRGGDGAVDSLFVAPPSTEEQLVDPYVFFEDHQGYLDVAEPKVPKGAEKFDDGPFGAIGWLLLLSERIPARQAVAAVQGWGGDSYVAYKQDGVSCASIAYAGDEPSDRTRMRAALTAWVRQMPKGTAHLGREGTRLLLTSCDPGADAAGRATGGSREALALAVSRTNLVSTLVTSGLDTDAARCAAARLIEAFTIAELNDPDTDQARLLRVMQPCLPS